MTDQPKQIETWQEIEHRERFQRTLEFLFDASRGEKQVFLEDLARQWVQSLASERIKLLDDVRELVESKKKDFKPLSNYPIAFVNGDAYREMEKHNQTLDDLLEALKTLEENL